MHEMILKRRSGNSMSVRTKGRKLAEQINYTREVARSCRRTGRIYSDLANFSKARDYDIQSLILDQTISNNQGFGPILC
jgi:hypothetical protein